MLRFCSLLFTAAASLAAAPCELIVSARYLVTLSAQAVFEGARRFTRIAVVADTEHLTPPCGDVEIVLANLAGKQESMRLGTLFPRAFDVSFL